MSPATCATAWLSTPIFARSTWAVACESCVHHACQTCHGRHSPHESAISPKRRREAAWCSMISATSCWLSRTTLPRHSPKSIVEPIFRSSHGTRFRRARDSPPERTTQFGLGQKATMGFSIGSGPITIFRGTSLLFLGLRLQLLLHLLGRKSPDAGDGDGGQIPAFGFTVVIEEDHFETFLLLLRELLARDGVDVGPAGERRLRLDLWIKKLLVVEDLKGLG